MKSSLVILLVLCLSGAVSAASPSSELRQDTAETQQVKPADAETDLAPPAPLDARAARAAPAGREAVPRAATEPSSAMALGKIVISLALVIFLVLGLGWLFKKLTLRLPGGRHIKVVTAMPLGQRERILVIEIQGKQRVIGVTPHSVNYLFELENPLPEEKLASDFHTQLQSFLKK